MGTQSDNDICCGVIISIIIMACVITILSNFITKERCIDPIYLENIVLQAQFDLERQREQLIESGIVNSSNTKWEKFTDQKFIDPCCNIGLPFIRPSYCH